MAKKTAKEVVQETVAAVKEVSEQTGKAVSEKVGAAQKTIREKVEEKPAVAEAVENTKKAVNKAVDTTRTTARKASENAKKVFRRPSEVVIQYGGKDVKESELVDKVIAAYVANGYKKSALKDIVLYVKPEDDAAYYVINDSITGKVDM